MEAILRGIVAWRYLPGGACRLPRQLVLVAREVVIGILRRAEAFLLDHEWGKTQ
jgi:hypothetical protein